jgi:hypothetical protein
MDFMDRMKSSAADVGQRAQKAGRDHRSRMDTAQAKRRADALLRDLGLAVYLVHRDGPSADATTEIERLTGAIARHAAESGAIPTEFTASA